MRLRQLAATMFAACLAPLGGQEVAIPSPAITEVESAGFNDEPAMAQADDGTFYVAWVSFRNGFDTLQAARYQRRGEAFQRLGAWQVAGGEGTYVLGPRMVGAGDGAYLLYSQEREGNWDVFAVRCGRNGPEKPVNISRHPASDTKPAGAWQDGTLWVAWESNREGARRVLVCALRGEQPSAPEVASEQARSSYSPSLAVNSNGAVWVAWHGFRQNNYDVWVRERHSTGSWEPERRLTTAPSIDREPVLLAHHGEVWITYENAQTENYLIGATNVRRLLTAKLDPRGLLAPKSVDGQDPLVARCEGPALAFDTIGRLWVAYLRPRLPRGGWEVNLAGHDGDKWVGPVRVTRRKGMNRRPSLALDGSYAVIALQADDFPESWAISDPSLTRNARSHIVLAAVDLRNLPAAVSTMTFEPLRESGAAFEAGTLRLQYGEDQETPTIDYQGQKLKLFYGDLHAHSDVSVCNRCGDQSLDQNYQHRRDINQLDFVAMTDHDYNFVPYLWNRSAKLVRANEDPGRLLTFLAEEWTSSFEKYSREHPYGYYGHRNLIMSDPYFPRWFNSSSGDTPAQLWSALRGMKADFVNIPHQLADTGNVPTDWNYTDEEAQPVAEIFQVRGSYEHWGAPRQAANSVPGPGYFLQDAWERGKVIGVIASPDHGGGRGKACVYATDLTRAGILKAIRQRHTFGTTAGRMFLDVRVNGRLMGEKIPAPDGKPVEVRVRAQCPTPIARVEVCRNNRFVFSRDGNGATAEFTFLDTTPLPGRSYYYVRVIQKDEEIGWSSPVWLGVR